MENKRNLFQRILGVMSDLSHISKGDLKVNGQYTFVSHDAVAAKVHPMLVKHGICVVPTVLDYTQDANRTSVKLSVNFINADDPQEVFNVQYFGYGIDNGDKGPGKAISYAFKYALLKTFCLETGDDPDQDANARYETPPCPEFDKVILAEVKEKAKMKKFLDFISKSSNIHVEDIKRAALKKPEEFLNKFCDWMISNKWQ